MTTEKLAIREQSIALTPAEVVDGATTQAKLLMNIVEQTKCYQEISGKKYLQVEAWETIGAFNRTHAETADISPIFRANANVITKGEGETIGYQARVQLWKDGEVVGGAIMPCYFTENCCKGKEGDAKHKVCMSAAQTFATSKAYRMNFSYVAILAGFQSMPAEEITKDMAEPDKSQHWCKEHDTEFFTTKNMKAYGHPVKDNEGNSVYGENGKQLWCHEHKEESPKATKKENPFIDKDQASDLASSMESKGLGTEWLTTLVKEKWQTEIDNYGQVLKEWLPDIHNAIQDYEAQIPF